MRKGHAGGLPVYKLVIATSAADAKRKVREKFFPHIGPSDFRRMWKARKYLGGVAGRGPLPKMKATEDFYLVERKGGVR